MNIAQAVRDESEACRLSAAQNGSPTAEIFHVMHVVLASLAKRLEPKDNEPAAGPMKGQSPEGILVVKPQEVGGAHYQEGVKVSPWSLQKEMPSSGNAFVDARRADAIKYTFRMKGDLPKLLEDMEKAKHCLTAAIAELCRHINSLPKA